jgi:hypothetical protein
MKKTLAAGSQVWRRLHGALRAFHRMAYYFNQWLVVETEISSETATGPTE